PSISTRREDPMSTPTTRRDSVIVPNRALSATLSSGGRLTFGESGQQVLQQTLTRSLDDVLNILERARAAVVGIGDVAARIVRIPLPQLVDTGPEGPTGTEAALAGQVLGVHDDHEVELLEI